MTTTITLRERHYRNILTWAYGADLISDVWAAAEARMDHDAERGVSATESWDRVKEAWEERHELSPGVLLMTQFAAEMPEGEWVAAAHEAILKMTPGRILDAARLYEMPEPTTDPARLIEWLEVGE